ncbi:MAG: deoxyribonuclease V [Planctomycetales bacterium]|nr:deoxyribonuclease V [Planctomycetales bacterium]
MRVARLHRWDLSPRAAVALQRRLAARVVARHPRGPFRLVAGGDLAYDERSGRHVACVVLWDLATGAVVEEATAVGRTAFPYVPGLLSFREAPTLLDAFRRLRRRPDAVLCDGQGLAHPRRFGLACHVGLHLGVPTAGCAKSLLVGEHGELGSRRGSSAPLVHRGEVVGLALRTRDRVRPVYVSVGHRISLEAARDLVLACGRGFRIPEPTRLADLRVASLRRALV